MHLLAHTNFVTYLITPFQLLCFLALSIFLVNLQLERFPHGSLLVATLILHDGRLVATFSQYVAVTFQLEVDTVLEYAAPNFHLRKVLLRDASIEVRCSCLGCERHRCGARSVHVESAVVGWVKARLGSVLALTGDHQVSMLLMFIGTSTRGSTTFLLLPKRVALFDLPVELSCELFLTRFLVCCKLCRILMQTSLLRQLMAANDAQMVLVLIVRSRVNCMRRVHHGLDGLRIMRANLLL